MMTIYANPPKVCQIPSCRDPIQDEFSDVFIPSYGCWGNICPCCAKTERVRYGTGLGQRYVKRADGKFVKTEG